MARFAGLVLCLSGCTLIADIDPDPQHVECFTIQDCRSKEPACRTATACEAGRCVFEDKAEGTSIPTQKSGDCQEIVCDGKGAGKVVPSSADVEDDGNPCTLDTCIGPTPTHAWMTELPCYTGPEGTRGKGICVDGVQLCTENGEPIGGCKGQVLPQEETCFYPLDENCNGKANEGGPGCACEPDEVRDCYTGPTGTVGVGVCKAGKQTCKPDGSGYDECIGETTPEPETCDAEMLDQDCDGMVNEEGPDCCGDGFLQSALGEECDDGNLDSSDMCTALCKLPVCGDGIVQPGIGEACDDGNLDSSDTCTALCQLPVCGDGIVQPGAGETCDDGNLDSTDACTVLCEPPACGDGLLQPALGEVCDDGNLDSTDMCTALCELPVCGDGIVQPGAGEACDDGNLDPTDTCVPGCQIPVCGDGIVQQGELCDDGNTAGGDACPSMCRPPFLSVTAGGANTCALFEGGLVKCWGHGKNGQLGLGDKQPFGDSPGEVGSSLRFIDLGAGKAAQSITTGEYHTCAILSDGSVKCWGLNTFGQLGLGDTQNRGDGADEMGDALPAVQLGAGKVAKAIATGVFHTCAILNDGSVKCWGYNHRGQLGLGNTKRRGDGSNQMGDALPAVQLGAGKTAKAISAGDAHTCALLNDGHVKCWGDNRFGQLGLGDTQNRGDNPHEMGDDLPAVDLGPGRFATAIASGGGHTCALLSDGSVACWGNNLVGQLGLGNTEDRGDGPNEMGKDLLIIDLGSQETAKALALGFFHTCAILSDDAVKCWGDNGGGQLGLGDKRSRGDDPDEMGDKLPAIDLGTAKIATAITAGSLHTCAFLNDGSIKCWGGNIFGQLGLGDMQDRGDGPDEMGDNLPAIP